MSLPTQWIPWYQSKISYEEARKNYRSNSINCPDDEVAQKMIDDILAIKAKGETCGVIELIVHNAPAGLGRTGFRQIRSHHCASSFNRLC